MSETVKVPKLSKSDKIVLTIFASVLILGIWIAPLFSEVIKKDVTLYHRIFVTLAGIISIIAVIKNTGEIEKPKSEAGKYAYRWMGWHRFYSSINLKILSVVFIISGIYFLFTERTYWWVGVILIVIAPMTWYLSIQIRNRAKEFFEAGAK